jgi:MFS family permease
VEGVLGPLAEVDALSPPPLSSSGPSREVPVLKRTLSILLVTSALCGLAAETYETTFALYLKHIGLAGHEMGAIFAIAAVATVFIRIYVGHLSDRLGRKGIYAGGVALAGVASIFSPLVVSPLGLRALRSVRDGANYVRSAMHSLFLFDAWSGRFRAAYGGTYGLEVAFSGVGALVAGYSIRQLLAAGRPQSAYAAPMMGAGAVLLVAAGILWVALPRPAVIARPRGGLSLRSLLGLDLPPVLRLLTARQFIFTVGLSTSHCFIMQQWFGMKFGLTPDKIGIVMALHRFSFGIPLMFVGLVPIHRQRLVCATGIVIQGVTTIATGLVSGPIAATVLWLSHDLLGASVWNPIYTNWVQRFADPEVRGRQASQSDTIAALGGAVGPLIAGWCVDTGWIDGPFILSGAIALVSAIPIAWLPRATDERRPPGAEEWPATEGKSQGGAVARSAG